MHYTISCQDNYQPSTSPRIKSLSILRSCTIFFFLSPFTDSICFLNCFNILCLSPSNLFFTSSQLKESSAFTCFSASTTKSFLVSRHRQLMRKNRILSWQRMVLCVIICQVKQGRISKYSWGVTLLPHFSMASPVKEVQLICRVSRFSSMYTLEVVIMKLSSPPNYILHLSSCRNSLGRALLLNISLFQSQSHYILLFRLSLMKNGLQMYTKVVFQGWDYFQSTYLTNSNAYKGISQACFLYFLFRYYLMSILQCLLKAFLTSGSCDIFYKFIVFRVVLCMGVRSRKWSFIPFFSFISFSSTTDRNTFLYDRGFVLNVFSTNGASKYDPFVLAWAFSLFFALFLRAYCDSQTDEEQCIICLLFKEFFFFQQQLILLMKNFIQYNIENIKGKQRAASLIERQARDLSPTKPKFAAKMRSPQRPYETMNDKVKRLESELYQIRNESHIMQDISQIKNDIKMIKSYLFSSPNGSKLRKTSEERYEENDDQETVYTMGKQARMKSHSSEMDQFVASGGQYAKNNSGSGSPQKRVYKIEEVIQQKMKKSGPGKPGISVKALATITKDYKIEGPQSGTIFYGYAKRNSQPVVVKYFDDKIDHIIEVYDRLWKNIAKAQWPCINRIFDYRTDEINMLIMEKNRSSIVGLPYKNILIDLIKIIEFIHDCGYLYRNIEPEHFMLNQEGQLVVVDFKRAKRYVDIKGHPIEVSDAIYTGSPFASNNQVRGLPQSRKDDLESIGYLSLLLNEMEIPWGGMGKEQVIKVRSGLTLQELFKEKPQWVEYMAYVMKLSRNERPDYRYLCQVIAQI